MKLIVIALTAGAVAYVLAKTTGRNPSERIRLVADQAAAKTQEVGETIAKARDNAMEAAAEKVEAMAGKAAETLRGQHPAPA